MEGISLGSLLTALASAAISSVLTYFSTRSKIRLDMTVEYDKSLRDKRLELYKELWPKTKPLARFSAEPLTYNVAKALSLEMSNWYFREGGIYLSKRSRKPYFHLKRQLQRVIDDRTLATQPDAEIKGKLPDAIQDAASRLRTVLADDIRTRRALWL